MLNWFKQKASLSLEAEIKRVISARILLSFCILFVAVVVVGALNVSSTLHQLEKNVKEECAILSDFTIGQVLIDNEAAVQLNLDNVNQENTLLHFEWIKDNVPLQANKMTWVFPFSWVDYCPIRSKDNSSFGYFKVSGSPVYNSDMLSELLVKMALILGFVFIIFLLLYPLGKRIPERIFVRPIMDLLNLLKSGWKEQPIAHQQKMPIEIQEIHEKLISLLKDAEQHSHDRAFTQIAEKVAHDIRSPLAALNMVLKKNAAALPSEERRIIQSATQRINDIANNLLTQKKDKQLIIDSGNRETHLVNAIQPEMAADLLENIMSEKRAQYSDKKIRLECHIDPDLYGVFIPVNAEEFFRALSNLINNSMEAMKDEGLVSVMLSRMDKKSMPLKEVQFSVIDTGAGIAPEQLDDILKNSVSIGKEQGSGIGLSSAIHSIESWKGHFSMQSEVGKGTRIDFSLPVVKSPSWFASHIWLPETCTVVILDDDESIHQMWHKRLHEVYDVPGRILNILDFYTPEKLLDWFKAANLEFSSSREYAFLFDYELLGSSYTGLDIIQTLNLTNKAALITGQYHDKELQMQCQKLGVKLFAKTFAMHIGLTIIESQPDFIFIDDSVYLTDAWKMQAALYHKKLVVFNTVDAANQAIHYFSKETPIYIDSNLEHHIKGEVLAKTLYEQGFSILYLCTGMDDSEFPEMPWIKAIVGKEYPEEMSK